MISSLLFFRPKPTMIAIAAPGPIPIPCAIGVTNVQTNVRSGNSWENPKTMSTKQRNTPLRKSTGADQLDLLPAIKFREEIDEIANENESEDDDCIKGYDMRIISDNTGHEHAEMFKVKDIARRKNCNQADKAPYGNIPDIPGRYTGLYRYVR